MSAIQSPSRSRARRAKQPGPGAEAPGKRKKTDEPPKGAQLLSPGRQAWELKANATFRSAEGRRVAQRSDMKRSPAARGAERAKRIRGQSIYLPQRNGHRFAS